jgi:hypothetical protein
MKTIMMITQIIMTEASCLLHHPQQKHRRPTQLLSRNNHSDNPGIRPAFSRWKSRPDLA